MQVIKSQRTHQKSPALMYAAMALVLTVINVMLVRQNVQFKEFLHKGEEGLVLRSGAVVPQLDGYDPAGREISLAYGADGRRTLLLVFSPTCSACKENMPNWRALVGGLPAAAMRVAAVSLRPDGLDGYLEANGLSDIPLVAEIDGKDRVDYNLSFSPQTILIDAGGRVERVWTGTLNEHDKAEIATLLGVELP